MGSIARHGRARYALKLALIAGAYYASAKLGLSLAFETGSVTAVWPPAGIALTALVLWGPSMWPGVMAGAFLANAWTGVPLGSVLGITCGNTLEALAAAYLLRQRGFRPQLDRPRDVLVLVLLAGGVATSLAATIGVASLALGGEIDWSGYWSVWRVWWLGDMGGMIVVAPALMLLATHRWQRGAPGRALEAAALAIVLVLVGVLVFAHEATLPYLMFPLLIWAALRFWQTGAALASLGSATIAVAFTAAESGPFVRDNPDDSLLLAQTFSGVASLTILLMTAILSERRKAQEQASHIARTLQQSLLPPALPRIPSLELGAAFRPAGDGYLVGGDFYDVFECGDESWAVVIGDVCGKGASAASTTALLRYTLRQAAIHERRPSAVLGLLNDALMRQQATPDGFCTVAFVRLEPGTEGVRATASSGGHPLPLVLRASGEVETLPCDGLLLGVEARPRLTDCEFELHPGDALLLFTDGLTDAYAPYATLGAAEVGGLLGRMAGRDAAGIAAGIEEAVLAAGSRSPRDDIALLVARVSP